MKNGIIKGMLCLAVALMFVSVFVTQGSVAAAMTTPAQGMKAEMFSGVVKNVDTAKKDVVVQYHKDKMTFSVGDKTKLYEGSKALKFSDLNKGLWASVAYEKEGNQLVAQTIHVSPVKQPKGMTEKKMMTPEKAANNKTMPSEKSTQNK
jgi:hypothetical protein